MLLETSQKGQGIIIHIIYNKNGGKGTDLNVFPIDLVKKWVFCLGSAGERDIVMKQIRKRQKSPSFFISSHVYAYESLAEQAKFQSARQDNTSVESEEDRRRRKEEEEKKKEEERKQNEEFWKVHSEPTRQVALATGAGAATGGVGGVKGAAAGGMIAGIAAVSGLCGSCHKH